MNKGMRTVAVWSQKLRAVALGGRAGLPLPRSAERRSPGVVRSEKRIYRIFGLLATLALASGAALAAVPQEFTYQGNLWENGAPVNGDRSMIFRITDGPGTSVYWSTGPVSVPVSRGHFAVALRPAGVGWPSVTPFIEVTVDGNVLLPREPLNAVPYTLHAEQSERAVSGVAEPAGVPGMLFYRSDQGKLRLYNGVWNDVSLGGDNPWVRTGSNIAFAGGLVGIGSTAPAYKLDVQGGSVNASGGLCIAGDCKTAWSQASPWTVSGNNLSFSGGSIGIGTSNPASALHIVNGDLRISAASGGRGIYFPDGSFMSSAGSGSASSLSNSNDVVVTADANAVGTGAVILRTGLSDRLVLLNNGNVGIGTSSPADRLHVAGGHLQLDYGSQLKWGGVAVFSYSGANVLTVKGAGNATRLTIDAAGNAGLGTATPAQRLDVQGGNVNASGSLMTGGVPRVDSSGNLVNIASLSGVGGNLNVNGGRVTNLAAPSLGTDAANKDYVDAATGGLGAATLAGTQTFTGANTFQKQVTVSSDAVVSGQLVAGSGAHRVTTPAGLLDAGKLSGALPGDVVASSHAAASVQDPAIVSVSASKVTGLNAGHVGAGSFGAGAYTFPGTLSVTGSLGAALNAGANKVTNLGAPSEPGDAATKGYVDATTGALGAATLAGTQTFTGVNTFQKQVSVSSDAVVSGQLVTGSGAHRVTTPAGLLDAGKLSGALPALDGAALSALNPASLAAGALPGNVVVSSHAAGSVPDAAIVSLSGSKLTGSVATSLLDGSSVTLQGNSFNAANRLVRLDASNALPAANASSLTGLTAANVTPGSFAGGAYTFPGPVTLSSHLFVSNGANVSLGGGRIVNLGAPAAGSDAATRDYVDSATGGLGAATLAGTQTFTGFNTFQKQVTVSSDAVVIGQLVTGSGAARITTPAGLLDAGKLSGQVPNAALDAASVTLQGNTFNAPNRLLRLDGGGALPPLSGANLTGLTAANVTPGSFAGGAYAFPGPVTLSSHLFVSNGATVSLGGGRIVNLGAPAAGSDAATRDYVDSATGGLGAAVLAATQTFTGQNVFAGQVTVTSGATVAGNVGIGTTSPQKALDVNGSIRSLVDSDAAHASFYFGSAAGGDFMGFSRVAPANDLGFVYYNGAWNTAMTILRSNGNVGVGTGSPVDKLHVAGGNINAGGGRVVNLGTPAAGSEAATRDYVDTAVATGGDVHLASTQTFAGKNTFSAGVNLIAASSDDGYVLAAGTTSAKYALRVTTSNQVAIGSGLVANTLPAPGLSLQVFGSQNVSSNAQGAVSNVLTVQNPNRGTPTNNAEARLLLKAGVTGGAINSMASVGGLVEDVGTGNGALVMTSGSGGVLSERIRITSAGNVGIGTQSPAYRMDVNGQANASELCIAGDCKTSWSQVSPAGAAFLGSTQTFTAQNTFANLVTMSSGLAVTTDLNMTNPIDLVGTAGNAFSMIRMTSYDPSAPFSNIVGKTARGTAAAPAAVLSGDNLVALSGGGFDGSSFTDPRARIQMIAGENWSPTGTGTGMQFQTTPVGSTSRQTRMHIAPDGSVGIGTTAPGAPLSIVRDQSNAGVSATAFIGSNPGLTPSFVGFSARGAAGAPQATQANDLILFLGGRGHDGTGFGSPPSQVGISMTAAENWTTTAKGTNLFLRTTPAGSTIAVNSVAVTASGNVGIGTTAPADRLHIAGGNINAGGGRVVNLGTPAAGSDAATRDYVDAATGGLGAALLASTQTFTGQNTFTAQATVSSHVLVSGGDVRIGAPGDLFLGSGRFIRFDGNAKLTGNTASGMTDLLGSGTAIRFFNANYGTELARIAESGNVGIGTTSPGQKLSVAGTVESTAGGFKFPDGTTQATAARTTADPAVLTATQSFTGQNTFAAQVSVSSHLFVTGNARVGSSVYSGSGITADPNTDQSLTLQSGSNSGYSSSAGSINLTAAATNGNGYGGSVNLTAGNSNLGYAGAISLRAGDAVNSGGGNGGDVTIRSGDAQPGTAGNGGSRGGDITLQAGTGTAVRSGNVAIKSGAGSGTSHGAITFSIAATERMRVDSSGSVGIGTASPGQKLTVAGTVESTSGGYKFPDGTLQATAAQITTNPAVLTATQSFTAQNTFAAQTQISSHLYVTGGNVGIGTSAPGANLDILGFGAGSFGGFPSVLQVSAPNANPNYLVLFNQTAGQGSSVYVDDGGSTHFGNSLDSAILSIGVNGKVGVQNTSPAYTLDVAGVLRQQASIANTQVYLGATGGIPVPLIIDDRRPTGTSLMISSNATNTGAYFVVNADGKVGVGTASPAQKLSVAGTVESTSGGFKFPDGSVQTSAVSTSGSGAAAALASTQTFTGQNTFAAQVSVSSHLLVTGGNVGLGTTSPSDRLHVAGGNINAGGGRVVNLGSPSAASDAATRGYVDSAVATGGDAHLTSTQTFSGQNTFAAQTTLSSHVFVTTGNVGIGTVSPGAALEVASDGTTFTYPTPGLGKGTVHLNPVAGADNNTVAITFGANRQVAPPVVNSGQAGIYVQSSGGYGTKMYFGTTDSFAVGSQIRMMINPSGNIGIGTTSPGSRLDVQGGDINASGAIRTAGTTRLDAAGNLSSIGNITANGTAQMAAFKMPTGAAGGYVLTSDAAGVGTWAAPAASVGGSGTAGYLSKFIAGTTLGSSVIYDDGANVGIGTAAPAQKLEVVNGGLAVSSWTSSGSSLFVSSTSGNVGIGTSNPIASLEVRGQLLASDGTRIFQAYGSQSQNVVYAGAWSNHDLALTSNNSEKLRIASSGNIGIGTTSPSEKFEVQGHVAISSGSEIRWHHPSAAFRHSAFYGQLGPNGGADSSLWINPNGHFGTVSISYGNVGIGTTSPSSRLHVKSVSNSDSGMRSEGGTTAASAPYLLLVDNQAGGVSFNLGAGGSGQGGPGVFSINRSGQTSSLAIDANGNVGVGTAAPSRLLHLSGLEPWIRFEDTSPAYSYLIGSDANNRLDFYDATAGQYRMSITPAGNVGIGTTVPSKKVHIVGANSTVGAITGLIGTTTLLVDNNNSSYLTLISAATGGAGSGIAFGSASNGSAGTIGFDPAGNTFTHSILGTGVLTLKSNGNVGVGTTNPGAKLDVQDALATDSYTLRAGTSTTAYHLVVSTTGNVGIGTSSPNNLLHVQQSLPAAAIARFWNTSPTGAGLDVITSATNTDYSLLVRSNDGNTVGLSVRNDGNVGIGTLSPTQKLDVNGIVNASAFYVNGSPFAGGGSQWTTSGTSIYYNGGNVGIGTLSPSAALDLSNSANWSGGWRNNLRLTSDLYPSLRFFATGGNKTSMIGNNNDGSLYFGVNGTGDAFGSYAMIIQPGGNVNIGTVTGPNAKLSVLGTGSHALFVSTDAAGGSGNLVVNSAGNVGIGTASPTRGVLHVAGGRINLEGNSADSAAVMTLGNAAYPAASIVTPYAGGTLQLQSVTGAGIFINASGNVGIGTTSPGTLEHLYSNSASGTILRIENAGAENSYVQLKVSTSTWQMRTIGSISSPSVTWEENGTERVRFASGGNVGIGTTVPDAKLHINAQGSQGLDIHNNSNAPFALRIKNDLYGGSTFAFFQESSGVGQIYNNGNMALAVDPAGKVGIGTTAPAQKLDVAGTVNASAYYVNGVPFAGGGSQWTTLGANIYYNAGNVGIGTTNPAYPLDVNAGSLDASATFRGSGTSQDNRTSIRILNTNSTPNGSDSARISFEGTAVPTGGTVAPYWELATDANRNGGNNFYLYNQDKNSNGKTILFVDGDSGNVGIGTASPTSLLHIVNPANTAFMQLQAGAGAGFNAQINLIANSTETASIWKAASSGPLNLRNAGSGSPHLSIDTSGNVGIGTTSPGEKLQVSVNDASLLGLRIANTAAAGWSGLDIFNDGGHLGYLLGVGSSNGSPGIYPANALSLVSDGAGGVSLAARNAGGAMRFFTGGSSSTNERMRIDSSGNVGIGTTSPEEKLHIVQSGASYGLNLDTDSTAWDPGLRLRPGSTAKAWITANAAGAFSMEAASTMTLRTNGADRVRIDSAGNVGIGTTNPGAKLHIKRGSSGNTQVISNADELILEDSTAAGLTLLSPNNYEGFIFFGDNDSYNSGAIYYQHSIDQMSFHTGGANTYRLVISSQGNVGIGTTAPGARLSIASLGTITAPTYGTADQIQMQMYDTVADNSKRYTDLASIGAQNGTAGGGVIRFITNPINSNNGIERMRIERDGNVGIGTTSPGQKLSVAGTIESTSGGFKFPDGSTQIAAAGSSQWAASGTNIYNTNTGSVGIGTASPRGPLDVNGKMWIGKSGIEHAMLNTDDGMYLSIDANNNSSTAEFAVCKDAADCAGTVLLKVLENGNVGIGTTSPGHALDVTGNIRASSNMFAQQFDATSGGGGNITNPLFLVAANTGMFYRSTSLSFSHANTLAADWGAGTYAFYASATTNPAVLTLSQASSGSFQYVNGSSVLKGQLSWTNSSGDAVLDANSHAFRSSDGASTKLTILNNGNVGIGTTNPTAKLHLQETANATYSQESILARIDRSGTITNNTANGQRVTGLYINNALTGTAGIYPTASVGLRIDATGGDYNYGLLVTSGNVGIGTTSPGQKLSVAGTIESTSGGFKFPDGSVQLAAAGSSQWAASGSNIYSTNSGNVGIGTTGPGAQLEVKTPANGGVLSLDSAGTSSVHLTLKLGGANKGFIGVAGSPNSLISGDAAGDLGIRAISGNILFGTSGAFGTNESMRITTAGNVGIGLTAPAATLHVVGDNANHDGVYVSSSATGAKVGLGTGGGAPAVEALSASGAATDLYLNPKGGVVYTGAASPGTPLTVQGYTATTNTTGASTSYGGIALTNSVDSVLIARTLGSGHAQLATDAAGRYLSFATGQFQERMRIDASGNVGIGTTNPGSTSGWTNQLHISGNFPGIALTSTQGSGRNYSIGSNNNGAFQINDDTAGVPRFYMDPNGNVGIGTTNPDMTLSVGTMTLRADDVNRKVFINSRAGGGYNNAANTLAGTRLNIQTDNPSTTFGGTIGGSDAGIAITNSARDNGKYAGIEMGGWTGYPSVGIYGVLTGGGSYTTNDMVFALRKTTEDTSFSEAMRIKSSGNVGIGTSSPGAKLEIDTPNTFDGLSIVGSASGGPGATLKMASTGGNNRSMYIYADARTTSDYALFQSDFGSGYQFNTGANTTGPLVHNVTNGVGSLTQTRSVASITAITNPADAVFYVAANAGNSRSINARGSVNANGADYAEWFPTKEQGLAPGEVVSLDSANPRHVARSAAASDPKTVGVVSTEPGFTGNDKVGLENPTAVAMVGQVPVKVCDDNGPIALGDPLASSSRPGYAAKAVKTGRILGFAMTPSDAKEGTVTAYLNPGWWSGETPEKLSGDVKDLQRRISALERRMPEKEAKLK